MTVPGVDMSMPAVDMSACDRWGEGLHQAVEAKERLPIQNETITLASISYQVELLLALCCLPCLVLPFVP